MLELAPDIFWARAALNVASLNVTIVCAQSPLGFNRWIKAYRLWLVGQFSDQFVRNSQRRAAKNLPQIFYDLRFFLVGRPVAFAG